jgi:Uma2 family endonuclease
MISMRAHPGPADVLLVVEVADTAVEYDRRIKFSYYARASISEAWLVDLSGGAVEVYRGPSPQGYADVQRLARGQQIAPLAFPQKALAVNDILGN